MRIRCPHCGERDNGEFSYLGDATVVRPDGMNASAEAMHDYVYLRDNPAGLHRELWYHGAGCRSWLVVTRDTRTHEIRDVSSARDVALARHTGDAA
ncbi:sarcosine oxidase subunit delta [Methylobacterium gnaphalii]|uniref:Sarcosine oxidase subunit delta n=1 Tax=Methylobacterium gnaphalii TaxID=1010610 RepID=A0A512JK53_9HYPH|nr:sarcosine oxidase subunit delta [Methylobacterium gnaphalii]GEP10345.1 sarcosine oxidase subunit delta [Methylobacterium gnaphalii]GJD68504.1 Sarcosine oxidase subunit delta [Methylobacterium gnaphalii]GLS51273.1 sarcosine oxidase subunit delta [Methylobacterium gnaphalii]